MGFSSENLAVSLPLIEVGAEEAVFSAAVAVPSLSTTSQSIAMWGASVVLPNAAFTGPTDFGWVGSITLPEPGIGVSASFGGLFSGSIAVPAAVITGLMNRDGYASIFVPKATVAALAHHEIEWGSPSIEVPQIYLGSWSRDDAADEFVAYAMNLAHRGVSEYVTFPVTSIAKIDGSYYATTAAGIFLLEGNDDAGTAIDAYALSGVTDFSFEGEVADRSMKQKRMQGAFFNLRCDGDFALVAVVDEDKKRTYNVSAAPIEGIHPRRVSLGRGLEGRNWQFGFKNVDGSDFRIKDLQVLPIHLKRHIRRG